MTGEFNNNPLLSSIIYDMEFTDGSLKEYEANVLAENISSSLDKDGHRQQTLNGIINHLRDGKAITVDKKYVVTQSGQRRLWKSTVGWKLLVRWKNGTEEWIPLRIMKEHYPLQVADYAAENDLIDQPAFEWWVPYVRRKRHAILSAVKAAVKNTTVKYGIRRPRSIKEALKLDEENGNHLWRNTIDLKLYTIIPAFDFTKIINLHQGTPELLVI